MSPFLIFFIQIPHITLALASHTQSSTYTHRVYIHTEAHGIRVGAPYVHHTYAHIPSPNVRTLAELFDAGSLFLFFIRRKTFRMARACVQCDTQLVQCCCRLDHAYTYTPSHRIASVCVHLCMNVDTFSLRLCSPSTREKKNTFFPCSLYRSVLTGWKKTITTSINATALKIIGSFLFRSNINTMQFEMVRSTKCALVFIPSSKRIYLFCYSFSFLRSSISTMIRKSAQMAG